MFFPDKNAPSAKLVDCVPKTPTSAYQWLGLLAATQYRDTNP